MALPVRRPSRVRKLSPQPLDHQPARCTFAHLALCAAAILRRAATDKVRFAVAVPLDFALLFVWDCMRTFAHRAL